MSINGHGGIDDFQSDPFACLDDADDYLGARYPDQIMRTDANPLDVTSDAQAEREARTILAFEDPWHEQTKAADEITYPVHTLAELVSGDFTIDYLIRGIVAKGQPTIVAGMQKTLKTSITLDLAISLASGEPFLGQFNVDHRANVLMMTGESGLPTLQETAIRICRAKGIDPMQCEGLCFSDRVPQIYSELHREAVRRVIAEHGADVLVIDPVYLAIDGSDAGNLFAMGQQLRPLAEDCQEAGVSLVLLHHAKKSNINTISYAPIELPDIAWSGFAEFARQWILLGRRGRYEPGSGLHQLWLSYGGSAGHSGCWGVDIDEGEFEVGVPRRWNVEVQGAQDAREAAAQQQEEAKAKAAERKQQRKLEATCNAIRGAYRGRSSEILSKSRLSELSGRNKTAVAEGVAHLMLIGEMEIAEAVNKANNRTYEGYRYLGSDADED